MSMVNLSLDIENVLPPPIADVGDASGDELDIASGARADGWDHRCLALG
jgi:hypothetical protein